MGVSELSAWVSLAAALLSIGYLAADYWRTPTGELTSVNRRSLGSVLADNGNLLVVAVTMGGLAFVTGWLVRTQMGVSPLPIWVGAGVIVVIVALGQFTDDESNHRS